MQKLFFLVLLTILSLFVVLPTHAQEPASIKTIIQEESITTEDLGVPEPTLLPSSPFYFLKEWTRGIQKALSFNPIKKAGLEVRFADEKIAEAKKLAAVAPERIKAISKALENYRSSQTRLKAELASLKQTSQNPEVDKLIEKIADRAVKHEKLLSELTQKFDQKPELRAKLDAAKEGLEENIVEAAKKDEAEKFAKRLEKVLVETKGSDLKHLRSVEILDRVSQKAPEELKENLSKIREDFSLRLKEDVEAFVEKHQGQAPELLKEALETIPGEKERRIAIIQEIQSRAQKPVSEALGETEKVLVKAVEEKGEIELRAKEAIDRAKEAIARLEGQLRELENVPAAVMRLAKEASLHLQRAADAFAEKKFGEAFGIAHSAEVSARNALRMLDEARPEGEALKKEITEGEEGIRAWDERIANIASQLQPKLKEILEEVRFHLNLAAQSLEKGALREAKKHLEEAKTAWRKLERVFHELRLEARTEKAPVSAVPQLVEEVKPRPAEKQEIVCTQEYAPVCGADGKTYPNACYASKARVSIKYKGACEEVKPETTAKPVPVIPIPKPEVSTEPKPTSEPKPAQEVTPAPPAPALTQLKAEADDKGFYPTDTLSVPKGARVKLTFFVRSEGVYYGGLDFRSEKFTTASVKPGGSTTVEFSADNSFIITSYWPASGVKKADLKIEVK